MKTWFGSFLIFFLLVSAQAQDKKGVLSGPMLTHVELRTAQLWLEAGTDMRSVNVAYRKKGGTQETIAAFRKLGGNAQFSPMQAEIGGLDFNTTYEYRIIYNGKATGHTGSFTTQDLWQFRKPPPDFSFLAGSCSYFNEPRFDRPGKPYGLDSTIFETMASEQANFMLWLGDNWYTREVDFGSAWGLWYRASRDRSMPVLQPFLKAMSHYAIWDDHDYGPNDIGASYHLKDVSREVFRSYWGNPSYGMDGHGVYSKLSYSDVDLFLMDDRTWRSEDRMPATVNGQPNSDKRMLGKEQLDWLKQSLLHSYATFKIVVMGSQVLNPVSPFDRFSEFPIEYNELMGFIDEQEISGVVFMSGDRHHSEIIRVNRVGNYPLYDITISPLTSGTHRFGAAEKENPFRVFGLDQHQNYGRITVTGVRGERKLGVTFKGVKGDELGSWSISEKELKAK